MVECWVCGGSFDRLSLEHIIPRALHGYVVTRDFSCEACNRSFGKEEERFASLGIFMEHYENARGYSRHSLPRGESPRKDRRWKFQDGIGIELFSGGTARAGAWESSVGTEFSGESLRLPGTLNFETGSHRPMVKALVALACEVGIEQRLLSVPLGYLRGDEEQLSAMEPTFVGCGPPEFFAAVWLVVPPGHERRGLYGVVVYGPIANVYRLCRGEGFPVPFVCELRAYQKEVVWRAGVSEFRKWSEEIGAGVGGDPRGRFVERVGPYDIRESSGSSLWICESNPSAAARDLRKGSELLLRLPRGAERYGQEVRFGCWARSLNFEGDHSAFLEGAREFDEDVGMYLGLVPSAFM